MSGDLLRWGVLSTAKIGIEKVIPATVAAARCEVVAIASRDLGRAESAASSLGTLTKTLCCRRTCSAR